MASKACAREGGQPVRQTSSSVPAGPTDNRSVGRVGRGSQNACPTEQQVPGTGSDCDTAIEVEHRSDGDTERGVSPRPRRNAAPRPGYFSSLLSSGRDGIATSRRSSSSRSNGHGRQGPPAPTSIFDIDTEELSDIEAPARARTAGRSQDGKSIGDVDQKQARGIAGSSDSPPEFTGEGHKSRRAQGFKPRGVKRRPAAEAAKKAKLHKSERTGPCNNMDGDSQDDDEEKWPRTLNKLKKFAVLESVKNSERSPEVYHMKGTGGVARKNWIANILAPARQDLAENAAYPADPCDVLADKYWKNVQRWVKSQREQLSKWAESHNGTGSPAPDESKLTDLHRKRYEAFQHVPAVSKAGAVETALSDSSCGASSSGEYPIEDSKQSGANIDSGDDEVRPGYGAEGGSFGGDVASVYDFNDYGDYDLTQPQVSAPLGAGGSVSRAPQEVQESMQQRVGSSAKGKNKHNPAVPEKVEGGKEARDRGRNKYTAFKTTSMQDILDLSKDDSPANAFLGIASSAIENIAETLRSGGGGDPLSASASAATPEGPRRKRGITAAEAAANAELLKFMASTTDETLLSYARRSLVKIDDEE